MQALVHVTLKKTVLALQGRTICSALNGLGHQNVSAVRQGKYFKIELADADAAAAQAQVARIACELLANSVIEDFLAEIRE